MMTSSLELSFDCKPADHMYSMLLKSFGEDSGTNDHSQKLEEFVARLEEERLKIDAFKRELPLCMQLLNNAMEASKQQLQSQRENEGSRPVLEQFIPLKSTNTLEAPENGTNLPIDHKASWMTSAQLWNQENEDTDEPHRQETEIKLALNAKQRMNGGAFLPFTSKDNRNDSFPELALASSHNNKEEAEDNNKRSSMDTNSRMENSGRCGNNGCNNSSEKEQLSGAPNTSSQTHRKARRCWSPDLHRRFVNALHMLGGSQVATPKQIRELMKVDGLTNDEVKSHLQKYRLHTRRPSPSPQTAMAAAPQVVVFGGIWVPPEYAAAAAAHHHGGAQAAAALYGTHQLPTPFSSAGQEMYSAMAPPPQVANHHHQLHEYNRPQVTHGNSFSESDVQRGAGDPSESIEDDKSESGSWKADSGGENGGDRKRGEGEESNASGVSLKF